MPRISLQIFRDYALDTMLNSIDHLFTKLAMALSKIKLDRLFAEAEFYTAKEKKNVTNTENAGEKLRQKQIIKN